MSHHPSCLHHDGFSMTSPPWFLVLECSLIHPSWTLLYDLSLVHCGSEGHVGAPLQNLMRLLKYRPTLGRDWCSYEGCNKQTRAGPHIYVIYPILDIHNIFDISGRFFLWFLLVGLFCLLSCNSVINCCFVPIRVPSRQASVATCWYCTPHVD